MFSEDVVPVMLVGFGVTVRPCGAPVAARFTAPAKPLLRTSVTVAVPLVPCATVAVVGATVIEKLGAVELKVAIVAAAPDVRLQVVVVPEHPPDQPAKTLPDAGVAVSVTAVPNGKLAEHVDPQLIPAGVDVTVPEPVPVRDTVKPG